MNTLTNLTISFLGDLPLIDYDEIRKAERRTQEAGNRLYLAVIAVAVFVGVWVFNRVVDAIRKIPRNTVPDAITSPPRASLSFICWALALACIIATFYLLYLRITADPPDSMFLLMISLISLGGSLLKQGNRLSTPLAEDVLESDKRRPIVFLRSFSEEEMVFQRSSVWGLPLASEQLEEVVLEGFRKLGPVVGLTNPSLRGRPIAYAPYDTLTVDWQKRVDELLKKAAIIAVVVAKSDGLVWEIRRIRDEGYLPRTVFIFPPVDTNKAESRLGWLQSQLGLPPDKLTRFTDESKSGVGQPLAMRFVGDELQVYIEPPDANGYVKSVERALKTVG